MNQEGLSLSLWRLRQRRHRDTITQQLLHLSRKFGDFITNITRLKILSLVLFLRLLLHRLITATSLPRIGIGTSTADVNSFPCNLLFPFLFDFLSPYSSIFVDSAGEFSY